MKSISVLVTGASSGIGQAIAIDLAHDGHQVFAGVRKKEDGAALQKANRHIIPLILDVTSDSDITTALEQIGSRRKNQPFCLINNAGIVVAGPVEALPVQEFRRQFDVNLFGLIAVTQACLPWIRETKGRIVNMSSISGRVASPFLGAYAASKFAVEGLTDSLRRELMAFQVKVSLIEPGPIETPIWDKNLGQKENIRASLNQDLLPVYEPLLPAFEKQVEEAKETADPVEHVVDAIKQALFALNPQHRYLVGRQARIGGLLANILPSKAIDTVIYKRLNAGRDIDFR